MFEMYISLNSVDKIIKFVNEVSKIDDDIDLVSGRRIVDAKSIMGIFCLDLTDPIKVVTNDENKELVNVLREYEYKLIDYKMCSI